MQDFCIVCCTQFHSSVSNNKKRKRRNSFAWRAVLKLHLPDSHQYLVVREGCEDRMPLEAREQKGTLKSDRVQLCAENLAYQRRTHPQELAPASGLHCHAEGCVVEESVLADKVTRPEHWQSLRASLGAGGAGSHGAHAAVHRRAASAAARIAFAVAALSRAIHLALVDNAQLPTFHEVYSACIALAQHTSLVVFQGYQRTGVAHRVTLTHRKPLKEWKRIDKTSTVLDLPNQGGLHHLTEGVSSSTPNASSIPAGSHGDAARAIAE
mmetsp:Transcript_104159/g.180016  ORF Transcript_104159/g.180016 Transcript_104159/m.180016 type:complete len:267 (-) Transcript_104159:64-864(-)